MAGAAQIAVCARGRCYPDMESAIMKVIAARPRRPAASDDRTTSSRLAVSTVSLALVHPGRPGPCSNGSNRGLGLTFVRTPASPG